MRTVHARFLPQRTTHLLKLWDLDAGKALRTLSGHSGVVNAVAVYGAGTHAISASADDTLKLWELNTDAAPRTLSGHSGRVRAVAVCADGRRAISASADHTPRLWDLDSGEAIATYTADAALQACGVANFRTFIAGDSRGNIHFIRLEGLLEVRCQY